MSDPYRKDKIQLTSHEVAQLLSIYKHGLTWAGDLISKAAKNTLVEFGLVQHASDGYYQVTDEGDRWIRQAEAGEGE